jgi:hypothetical protein
MRSREDAVISGWRSTSIGFALMAARLLLGLVSVIADERVKRRFPYVIVRRSAIGLAGVPSGVGSQGDRPNDDPKPWSGAAGSGWARLS